MSPRPDHSASERREYVRERAIRALGALERAASSLEVASQDARTCAEIATADGAPDAAEVVFVRQDVEDATAIIALATARLQRAIASRPSTPRRGRRTGRRGP